MATVEKSLQEQLEEIGKQAREASHALRSLSTTVKDDALRLIAKRLRASKALLQEENAKDLVTGAEKGLSQAMLDRLTLTDARIDGMAGALEVVASLPDPVGDIVSQTVRPNGLRIAQIRQALGVVGIIYESRPNVTADAAGLCLKSGNACVLRGGSEAIHSNVAIAKIFVEGAVVAGVHEHAVQIITTTDREAVGEMLKLDQYIDLIVPRGGRSLIERIYDESRIPVVAHLDGVCHTYVHEAADLDMAKSICLNAKLARPSVCNAMETMLVDAAIAEAFLQSIAPDFNEAECELRGCERTQEIISCNAAEPEDWTSEYNDTILAIKIVDSLEEAIHHINEFGSHHSDAIVTDSYTASERFLDAIDSATVYVNASTYFTDGYEFGLGAELGISTSKLHCRGPMALKELTSLKYVIRGTGQIRT
ncbi:MAG: glutamate-5-semialdehyde dehydrogenase [Candidatus Hydrogenedentota bacterium]